MREVLMHFGWHETEFFNNFRHDKYPDEIIILTQDFSWEHIHIKQYRSTTGRPKQLERHLSTFHQLNLFTETTNG